jgi:hypothetical protein
LSVFAGEMLFTTGLKASPSRACRVDLQRGTIDFKLVN